MAVAGSPVLEQIDTLDLSLGALTDDGAKALLASSSLKRLKLLDLHYHYLSEAMVDQLLKTGMRINADERREPDEYHGQIYRYVAVGE